MVVGNNVVNDNKQDVLVNLMRPFGSSGAFQWLRKKDKCWVPLDHLLCILPAASTASSGHQYKYDDNTLRNKEKLFQNFTKSRFNARIYM